MLSFLGWETGPPAPPAAPRRPLARAGALAAVVMAGLWLAATPAAARRAYVPPNGKVFHGVSDTGEIGDFRDFREQVGAHPALLQDFFHWGVPLGTGALDRWDATDTRGVLSLSTAPGGQPEVVTPGAIARGFADDYMVNLNESIGHSGQVVYIRPFPEMNGHWNPYCAFDADGSPRDSSHSAHKLKQAWRRLAVIVRGGPRRRVNHRLRALGMPRIHRARSNDAPVYSRRDVPRRMPRARVAFIWNPQTTGSPDVPGNRPRDYWPGRRFVDWVAADIYAKFQWAAFPKLTDFYRRWHRWPFAIGEYAPWDSDPYGSFVRRLFDWARRRQRVRALIYYRSVSPSSAYDIDNYPAARDALRRLLNGDRFREFAPHTRDRPGGGSGGTPSG